MAARACWPVAQSKGSTSGPRTFTALAFLSALLVSSASTSSLAADAFPGAGGFGRLARGGDGGAIIPVTNLADSGPGSLRACIDAEGPRVCVFRIGGVIRFTTAPPIIRNPYITIAGQTAPGGGILLTHAGGPEGFTPLVVKNTHDVIIRHVRVRTDLRGEETGSNDAFTIEGSHNVILDHVSGSWAIDELIGNQAQNDNVTISSSIFAEGIPPHDKCALLGSDPTGPQRISFLGNLCAHSGDRNPDVNFTPGSCIEIVNNVFYNAGSQFAEVWESYGGTPVSLVGNVFRPGPNTAADAAAIDRQTVASTGAARIYQAGNRLDGNLELATESGGSMLVRAPACPLSLEPASADQAYDRVLAAAGAFPRDSVDQRIVDEVRSRTGAIVTAPGILPLIAGGMPYPDADGDGMSDLWERENDLDTGINDAWGDEDGDGWTNLDEFLDYAHRHVLTGDAVPVSADGMPWWLSAAIAAIALAAVVATAVRRAARRTSADLMALRGKTDIRTTGQKS